MNTSAWRRLAAAAALMPLTSQAQVVLDNFTLGDTTDDMILNFDASNTFDIGETLGLRAGANLFHSFHAFGLAAGQTALFSGDPAIANIVARVTGGDVSLIDGTISSTIDGADFWFVNPAGVIFGANAAIDVGGAFNAGAADFIGFDDDLQFSAFDGSVTLSVASPAEFGFLDAGGGIGALQIGPNPNDPDFDANEAGPHFAPDVSRYDGLSFAGRSLTVTNSLIGSQAGLAASGDIAISADRLTVTNSEIYADTAAALDAGIVTLNGRDTVAIHDSVFTSESLAASAGLSGKINIDGGNSVDVRNSLLTTQSFSDAIVLFGDLPGEITIVSGGELQIHASTLTADTLGDGLAGQIDLGGNTVLVVGSKLTSGSTPVGDALGTGVAGIVEIEGTASVELRDSFITTKTYSDADIDYGAGTIELDDVPGSIEIVTPGELLVIRSDLTAATFGTSDAGFIELNGRSIRLEAADVASTSEAVDGGWAGDILLTATDDITIVGADTDAGFVSSTLSTDSYSQEVRSPGTITVSSTNGALLIRNAALTSDTFGASEAGQIDLDAVAVSIEDSTVASNAEVKPLEDAETGGAGLQVQADAFDLGVAGIVEIEGRERVALRNSTISTITYSDAAVDPDAPSGDVAGSIEIVTAGSLSIAGSHLTATTFGSSGAGIIDLSGATISLDDTEVASTSSTADSGVAGTITISAVDSLNISESSLATRTYSDVPVFALVRNAQGEIVEEEQVGYILLIVTDGGLEVSDSSIASAAFGDNSAGYVDIEVSDNVTIAGGELQRAGITTRSDRSTGGIISLEIGGDLDIVGGFIEASAGEAGSGGDVFVTAGAIFLRDSGIFARADLGNGGLIVMDVTGQNQLFVMDTESWISADSGSGINGDVDINAPDADLAASLQQQDANIVVAPELAADACSPASTGELSTFVQEDEGGTPTAPDRYLNASIRGDAVALAAEPTHAASSGELLAAVAADPREACR